MWGTLGWGSQSLKCGLWIARRELLIIKTFQQAVLLPFLLLCFLSAWPLSGPRLFFKETVNHNGVMWDLIILQHQNKPLNVNTISWSHSEARSAVGWKLSFCAGVFLRFWSLILLPGMLKDSVKETWLKPPHMTECRCCDSSVIKRETFWLTFLA